MFTFLIALCILIPLILLGIYNTIISRKNKLRESLSGIDVQLKKRHDLIPNILTIAKRFMEHEKEIFENITELRTQAMLAPVGSKSRFVAENKLDNLMSDIFVSVENYPELKSDSTMVTAMQTYNEVEEHIAAARRFYNSSLTELRNIVMMFPGCMFANIAQEEMQFSYFEAERNVKSDVNASDYLN